MWLKLSHTMGKAIKLATFIKKVLWYVYTYIRFRNLTVIKSYVYEISWNRTMINQLMKKYESWKWIWNLVLRILCHTAIKYSFCTFYYKSLQKKLSFPLIVPKKRSLNTLITWYFMYNYLVQDFECQRMDC